MTGITFEKRPLGYRAIYTNELLKIQVLGELKPTKREAKQALKQWLKL